MFKPGFKIGRESRRGEVIGIDLVVRNYLRRRRNAEDGHISGYGVAKRMQQVGMADKN